VAGVVTPSPQQVSWQQRRLWNQSRNRDNSPRRHVSQHEPHEPLQPLSQQSRWNRPRSFSNSRGRQLSQQLFSQTGLHSFTHFVGQAGLHSLAQDVLQDVSQQSPC